MYERVLLVVPPVSGVYSEWPGTPHVGIGYLSEFLSLNGIENDVVDMGLGYSLRDLKKKIRVFNPDLIGVTAVTHHHDVTYNIIDGIQSPEYDIVVGGPHVSTIYKKVLADCKADFAVKSEGEHTLLELCKGHSLSDIKGLLYRNGDEIIENENRPFIENLDEIPFPRYKMFELDLYMVKQISILSSRGCPYGCIYCPIKATIGRKYRARSAENVVDEMKYWYERGYRDFSIVDDNFTFYKDRVYEICDLMEKEGLKDVYLSCGNGIRADRVDWDILKRMREVGFGYIAFGVESASDRVLKRIKKGEDVDTIERSIKNACELGFEVGLFFMIGNPGETLEDVKKSFRLASKYPVKFVFFYDVVPFPGTELYEWVTKNNYLCGDLDDLYEHMNRATKHDIEPFFETPELPYKERKEALINSREIMAETREKYRRQKFGSLSKRQVIMVWMYESVRKLINYQKVLTWLLGRIPNRKVKILMIHGIRKLSRMLVLNEIKKGM